MKKMVYAARMNGVYYDDCEVSFNRGYDETEGCSYSIVRKKAVDSKNQPIFVKLAPAFDNPTNSGITQGIFDVSFIKSANMIITAVDPAQGKWNGPAMWKGAPIPGEENTEGWVYGFNRQGALRVFKGDVSETVLCQNNMVDVIGGCTPIILNNAITEQAEAMTDKGAISAIGFNVGNGDVFFFQCSAEDQVGMTGASVAKVLSGFGCTIAVITSFISGENKNISNGMLYMGQMCEVPNGANVPQNVAYWYISKCPGFNNDFQKEIADLVQTTGRNAWNTYLLGVQLQYTNDRVAANTEAIKAEVERATAAEGVLQDNIDKEQARAEAAEKQLQDNIDAEQERAMNAEQMLQQNINAEQNRAMEAERLLQENINAEVNRATAAEDALDKKIDAETARAEGAEKVLQDNIDAEQARAETAEGKLDQKIDTETERATNRENEIYASLQAEITARINADNDLISALEQETLARKAADANLQGNIDRVESELTKKIQDNTNLIEDETTRAEAAETDLLNKINAEKDRAEAAEGDLQTNINNEINRATTAETELQTNINNEVTRATAKETELEGKISENTTNITNLTTQVTNNTTEIDALKDLVDSQGTDVSGLQDQISKIEDGTTVLPYLPLAGGNMNSMASISWNAPNGLYLKRTGVETPSIIIDKTLSSTFSQPLTSVMLTKSGVSEAMDLVLSGRGSQGETESRVRIKNINEPIDLSDAATKNYVDSMRAKYLPLTGGTITGPIDFAPATESETSVGRITGVPAAGDTPGYLEVRGNKIEVYAGNTHVASFIEQEGISPDPDTPTTKYPTAIVNGELVVEGVGIDTATIVNPSNISTGELYLQTGSESLPLLLTPAIKNTQPVLSLGNTRIINLENPVEDQDAATKAYVDTHSGGGGEGDYLPLTGGTLTGSLSITGDTSTSTFGNGSLNVAVKDGATLTPVLSAITQPKSTTLIVNDAENEADNVSVIINPSLHHTTITGEVDVDSLGVKDIILKAHTPTGSGTVEHLDINVPTSTGSVYINRSENGATVEGGTGELNVTSIKAPNELRLQAGTQINSLSPVRIDSVFIGDRANEEYGAVYEDTDTLRVIYTKGNNTRYIMSFNTQMLSFNDNILTNVKDGVNDYDAATVGQVRASQPQNTEYAPVFTKLCAGNISNYSISRNINASNVLLLISCYCSKPIAANPAVLVGSTSTPITINTTIPDEVNLQIGTCQFSNNNLTISMNSILTLSGQQYGFTYKIECFAID